MSDDDPCKRDADSQACKNFREADALATEFESVCRADSRELVASLATTGLGVGIVETGARLFKATRVATGVPSGRLGLQAAAAGPVGVMQAFGAGDTTYNNAGVNRAKAVLGFVPGVAPVVDFIEAASSCRDARVWRGRVNAMR